MISVIRSVSVAAALAAISARGAILSDGPFDDWKRQGASVRVLKLGDRAIAAGGDFAIEFDCAWRDVIQKRPDYPWSGVMLTARGVDADGKTCHVITSNLGWGGHERDTWRIRGVLPPGITNFVCTLALSEAEGKLEYGRARVELSPCDPAKRIRGYRMNEWTKKPVDLDYIEWYEGLDLPKPTIPGRSFAFFRIREPGLVFDRFAPPAETLQDEFRIALAPGETRDLFFGVYAGANPVTLKILKPETWKVGCVAAKLFRALNWKETGDMGQRHSYTVLPEVLLPWKAAGESVTAGGTAMAMVQFAAPEDAEPGIYPEVLVFTAANGERRAAKITVEVLPFKLIRPEPENYELIAHIGQYGETKERFAELVKHLKCRGFESLLIATHYGTGRMKFRLNEAGRIEIESFDRLRFAVAAYRAAGMKGTLFVHLSDKLEVEVAKALGIKVADAHGEQTNMIPEFERSDFRAHVREAVEAIKAEGAGLPLAILAMDEPNTDDRKARAAYEIANLRDAGAVSALYGNARAYRNTKPDYLIASEVPGQTPFLPLAEDIARRPGARLYLYEGSGSYHYSYGSMYIGRFNHGWGDYLAPGAVHGHTAWNFLANAPTDFEGTAHLRDWVHLSHFDRDMNFLWTLEFEAICEGYMDRVYLNTLERKLQERASRDPLSVRAIAAEFAALKAEVRRRAVYRDRIRQVVMPPPKSQPIFTSGDMDEVRERLISWLRKL